MTDGGENVTDDESTRVTLRPWSDRWKNKRIGFHLSEVNPILIKHATALLPSSETCDAAAGEQQASSTSSPPKPKVRIFVPLCGKAVDMAYLATSVASSTTTPIEVVGLEGIRLALEEFIEEHPGLGISREAIPSTNDVPFERFEGETVSLWKGDYFDLSGEATTTTTTAIGSFEAIYDRASIVAIEPELREDYVKILDNLLVPGGRILLVALERVVTPENASAGKRGPPYSIPEATLRGLFANLGACGSYNVEILQQTDQLVEKPEDRERYPDLEQLLETVYLIQKGSA